MRDKNTSATQFRASLPKVSIIVVARDAAHQLSQCLEDLARQDWPLDRREFILVDGESSDGTRSIMVRFKVEQPDERVLVCDNPKRILSAGWNVALRHAQGDVVIRVDAHSQVPPDFVRKNLDHILRGENIVGGVRISVASGDVVSGLIQLAENSRFGAGQARYRRLMSPGYVDTLGHAAYRREVFDKVGGYDERLGRTEDNEIHHRMHRAGFQFYYDPEIKSWHLVRGTILGYLKQKYLSGLWIGLTLAVSPLCFRVRHFVPFVFVCAVITGFLLPMPWKLFGLGLLGVYFAVALVFALIAVSEQSNSTEGASQRLLRLLFLPVLFFLMHAAYGVGTLLGIILIPLYWWRWRKEGKGQSNFLPGRLQRPSGHV